MPILMQQICSHDLSTRCPQPRTPTILMMIFRFSDFYRPSEGKENGKLLFVTVGTRLATYSLYKYLK